MVPSVSNSEHETISQKGMSLVRWLSYSVSGRHVSSERRACVMSELSVPSVIYLRSKGTNSLLGCLWACRSSILPVRGTRHIRQENPGRLALWAFLDWQVFLIQEECYYGKPSGLSIGELPSGSLDDQGMCLLRWSLLFRTAVPLWKLSFELEGPERRRWRCYGDLARYETWGAVSQSANASFCKVIHHGLAISWRGDDSGVCNLEGLADSVGWHNGICSQITAVNLVGANVSFMGTKGDHSHSWIQPAYFPRSGVATSPFQLFCHFNQKS